MAPSFQDQEPPENPVRFKLMHTCVLERFVDVRDHALLLLPLLPAGGATPSGCGHDGAVVLVGSPGGSG
jgi:hypothetical protein